MRWKRTVVHRPEITGTFPWCLPTGWNRLWNEIKWLFRILVEAEWGARRKGLGNQHVSQCVQCLVYPHAEDEEMEALRDYVIYLRLCRKAGIFVFLPQSTPSVGSEGRLPELSPVTFMRPSASLGCGIKLQFLAQNSRMGRLSRLVNYLGTWGSLSETHARHTPEPTESKSPCWGWRDLYFGKYLCVVMMYTPLLNEKGLCWPLVLEVTC